jgi:mRNA interferase MazF
LAELSHATVLLITTDLRLSISMRIDILPTPENGLREPSQVMVDWPQTVRTADMGQVIGRLDEAVMRMVTQELAVVLGIGAARRRGRD